MSKRQRSMTAFVVVGIGLLVLFAAAVAAYFVNQAKSRTDLLITHTIGVLTEGLQYQTNVQSAVIAERAFIVTGDAQYRTDFERAIAGYAEARDRVRALTADNPSQQLRLDNLDIHAEKIISTLQRIVSEAPVGGDEISETIIRRSNVDAMLHDFNDQMSHFIKAEQRLFTDRRDQQLKTDRLVGQLILGSLTIIAGLLLMQVAITSKQNRAFRAHRVEILLTNAELEQRVQERTVELEMAKQSLEDENLRVESLLRDLHHRVGNSLQLVASFLGLQANQVGGEEAKATLRAARGRVLAIASTQRRLSMSGKHEKVPARDFIQHIIDDLNANLIYAQDISIQTDIGDFDIPSRDAVSIGVLISEMVTNAVKYAFEGRDQGLVRVSCNLENAGETCVLCVEDDGVGFAAGASNPHGGLGARIIDSLVAALGGEIGRTESTLGSGPGARLCVTFPFAATA